MRKYTSADWDEVRKKFRNSIMAETSLISLAQNLDMEEWPVAGEEEKPTKYIDFTWDELLMLPEIEGKTERISQLVSILKETLAFDDPFGDMVAQVVEETAAKENPILKTLSRLGIPHEFPLELAQFSSGTRAVCASEGINTIGEFANLGQQMATRVVLGGDFRNALNALTHGDEEGIGHFLPYRRGTSGLHLPEAIGLIAATLTRPEQLAFGKFLGAKLSAADAATVAATKEQAAALEASLRAKTLLAFGWFKDQRADLLKKMLEGTTLERFFLVINDTAREAIAIRLASTVMLPELERRKVAAAPAPVAAATAKAAPAAAPQTKKGFWSRLLGK